MEIGGRTIIISTPEELLPLITEAVRLANNKNVQSMPSTRKLSHTGDRKVLARHIRALAGASSMNALYWKNILPPGASKLRNQNDGFLRPPAYPL